MNTPEPLRAVIVGAGIGGLAAGIALRRIGIEPLIVERAREIREAGAGLSLWSNAVYALRQLGVQFQVLASASVIERGEYRTREGRQIVSNDLAEFSGPAGAPSVVIHRAALQRALLEGVPAERVRTDACCTALESSAILLESGERIPFDVLIGADGIDSAVRAALHGARPPRYAGYHCWRGIVHRENNAPDHAGLLVLGGGSQFGLWPCGPGMYYWFLTRNAPAGVAIAKTDALAVCRDWAPPVPEIVERTPGGAILANDIIDRPPLRTWGRGRVTLLGDAAHPATPNLGQGACQAIEDAVVLADCLRRIRPIENALREYERLRIPRTTAVVRASWRLGRMLQGDNRVLDAVRNLALSTSFGRRMGVRTFRQMLDYKVPALNI